MKNFLIIIVGPSGVGKSTFIRALGLPRDCIYVTSEPMIRELEHRGIEVTHDTIFALSEEWYAKDPLWQVPLVLESLKAKRYIVVDGPRRLPEVRRFKQVTPSVVVKVISTPTNRFQWLKVRGKISLDTPEEFRRLEEDESKSMDVGALMDMADLTIENSASQKRHERRAKRFGLVVRFLSFLPRALLITALKMAIH